MTSASALKQRTAEIRQRMQAIRSDLPISMEEARDDVSKLTDWKYYVRQYPQWVLPAVAVTAYSLVPYVKKTASSQVAYLDNDQGIRRVRLVDDSVPRKTFAASLFSSLLALAFRSGSSMAVRHFSQMLHGPHNPK